MYLKLPFVIIGVVLFLLLSFYKLYVCKKPRTEKTSSFISFIAALLLLYVIGAIVLAIFIPGLINKALMVVFALSPFIIGKLATYEKEKLYSFLQIIFVVISIIYTVVI